MKRLIAPIALVTALAAVLVLSAAALGHGQSRGGLKKATIMKGRYEVPPADPDGLGHALIRLKPATSQVCWRLWARRIAPATASHIHRGARGVNGPIVVPLTPPTTGRSAGCVAADPALIDEIRLHPGRFYVNVHNADFPGGAIRGQLHGLTGHQ
jgi:hypothetical protein